MERTPKARKPTATVLQPPAGVPAWVTSDFIEQTIRVWQPYYEAPLTPDDAMTIILSIAGLVETLSQRAPP